MKEPFFLEMNGLYILGYTFHVAYHQFKSLFSRIFLEKTVSW